MAGRRAGLDSARGIESVAQPLTLEDYERLDPVATLRRDGHELSFHTPNRVTLWRVQTVLQKEPGTIEWIESFAADDVFVDVGANVGMYSLWAAKYRGARVFAFEPEAQSYAVLCRNIAINALSGRAVAYCLALSDESKLGTLHLTALAAGHSCHSFDESVNFKLEQTQFPFSQGCVAGRLDELVAGGAVPTPNHIKIDVDGFEHKVIAGAGAVLGDPACRSILVEINRRLEPHREIIAYLTGMGFRYSEEEAARAVRTEGLFEGCGNYVFRR